MLRGGYQGYYEGYYIISLVAREGYYEGEVLIELLRGLESRHVTCLIEVGHKDYDEGLVYKGYGKSYYGGCDAESDHISGHVTCLIGS